IHSPCCQCACDVGKKKRAVLGHNRQFIPMPSPNQLKLNGIRSEMSGEFEVLQNFLGAKSSKIALGQSFQKGLELLCRMWNQRLESRDVLIVLLVGMEALIGGAAQTIRRGNVELPHILSLPGRQRLGIHRLDVCISEQCQQFEPLGRAYLVAECLNRSWIVDIPAQSRGNFKMAGDQE